MWGINELGFCLHQSSLLVYLYAELLVFELVVSKRLIMSRIFEKFLGNFSINTDIVIKLQQKLHNCDDLAVFIHIWIWMLDAGSITMPLINGIGKQ